MEDILNAELLTPESKNHLSQSGKWAKVVGIIGMIFSCLMGLMSVLFIFGMQSLSGYLNPLATEEGLPGGGSLALVGILYLGMAAVYFFMSWCAYRFGSFINSGLHFNSADGLTNAFKNLKNYFTIQGVILIAAIAMSILALLVVSTIGFFMK